jgi:hypothetical protein
MTQDEARAWLNATERSRMGWQLDQIHCTSDDALIYKGGSRSGYYINLRKIGNTHCVDIGTYEDAIPHIGDAHMMRQGRKPFTSPELAVAWLREKVKIPQFICNALLGPARVNRSDANMGFGGEPSHTPSRGSGPASHYPDPNFRGSAEDRDGEPDGYEGECP